MTGAAGSDDPMRRVLALLAGKWLTAAISAAATLGIPDALADRPKPLAELASELGCDPSALVRLLRMLVGEQLVRKNATGEYELLEAGRLLRHDALGRLARYVGSPLGWDPWSDLVHSVRTGESAFVKRHGRPLFDHLDRKTLRMIASDQPIAVPENVGGLVHGLGFQQVRELKCWESFEHGALKITLTPARHWGARMLHDTHRGFGGFVIEYAGRSLFHCGDSAYFSGFREIGERLPIEIALLPIGAYDAPTKRDVHMNPEQALQAFEELGDRHVQRGGDIVKPARGYSIDALLVLLDLLKGNAK